MIYEVVLGLASLRLGVDTAVVIPTVPSAHTHTHTHNTHTHSGYTYCPVCTHKHTHTILIETLYDLEEKGREVSRRSRRSRRSKNVGIRERQERDTYTNERE